MRCATVARVREHEPQTGLGELLDRARTLVDTLEAWRDDRARSSRARLKDSVVRPLGTLVEVSEGPTTAHDERLGRRQERAGRPAEEIWELARLGTIERVRSPDVAELAEAVAALQDLAITLAEDESEVATRVAELKALQAELPCRLQCQANGPYLVTNVENLTNWLGERLPTRPQMALCRCGQSAIKPLCDGTHAEIGFTAAKDPKRVPDRRDAYVGQQVTILDNRGICQHSGYCTDRLAGVFHLGEEPFVTPSGGRMDEIIRAVRDCPSGALSYAIDEVEARDEVDYHGKRELAIEVSRDGPYRVTGEITLTDSHGDDEPRNQGASREHYALCRCGHSQNKPFCSGVHWYVDFKDPVPGPDHEPTIFEWCGGLPALTKMTRLFYEKYVPQDPLLAPLFANMSADHPQRVAKWLAEVFCGPKDYSEQYGGYPRMISQHIGKGLTEERRARWVALLLRCAQEAGLPADPEWRSAFGAYIEWGSRLALENSQPGARPPEHMPMPHWDWQTSAGPPGSRISALAPVTDEQVEPSVLPAHDEPVRFEKHIKPLFRQRDRQSMKFAFDLWAFDDVKQNAHAILERLQNGSMPCDGAWAPDKVDAFERWVATGMSQ
jgi:CDGSH-type Zn-finger protein/truncated hemoglobin YjbI